MMMRILFTACFLFVIHIDIVLGYDDQATHPQITEIAIRNAPNLNTYMKTSLGFEKGISSHLPSNSQNPKTTALELLKTGSTDEDSPMCRAANHFHNPRLPWSQSYLTDAPVWIDKWCHNVWPDGRNIPTSPG